MIKVSGVLFLLFLRGIWRISGDTLDKLSLCAEKTETLKLSLWISIYEEFYILILLWDKLLLGIDFDLSTVFSVSVFFADLYLSIDLTLSVLLLLGVFTVLLDACDFSVLLTTSIIFFSEIGGVKAFFTTLSIFHLFLNHVSILFLDKHVSSSDQCLFRIFQIPTCFYDYFNCISRLLRQWANDIGWHDLSA